jgi:hypothetical protein
MPSAPKSKRPFDRNFTATRSLFCAILEQAVDDWRALQRAGRIPIPATRLTPEASMEASWRSVICAAPRSNRYYCHATLTLDRFCAHMTAIIKPEGIRRHPI